MSRVSKGAKELALKIKRGRKVETQGRMSRENRGGTEYRNENQTLIVLPSPMV